MRGGAGPRTFIDEIIRLAGGRNALADRPTQYPLVSAEQILAANPDVIVLGDGAFGVSLEDVAARRGWGTINAVQRHAISTVDPDLVSRPVPRLAEGLEAYARILHPELFP